MTDEVASKLKDEFKVIAGLGEEANRLRKLILEQFLELGRALTRKEIAEELGFSTEKIDSLLKELDGNDILVVDGNGEIAAAYPYSSNPTVHRVQVEDKRVFANCAVDALGIPFMVRRDAAVESECAYCDRPIKVVIQGARLVFSEPAAIHVWLVESEECDCAHLNSTCPHINFFCSTQHLNKWSKANSNQKGWSLNLEEATQAAKTIFEKFLD